MNMNRVLIPMAVKALASADVGMSFADVTSIARAIARESVISAAELAADVPALTALSLLAAAKAAHYAALKRLEGRALDDYKRARETMTAMLQASTSELLEEAAKAPQTAPAEEQAPEAIDPVLPAVEA